MRITNYVVALGLVALAGIPAFAGEQTDEQASAVFKQGTAAFAEKRFIEAADAFREAQTLKPSWKLLYNIGQAETAGRRYGLAFEAFEKYLVEGGDEIDGERQDAVRTEIERLRGLIGFLKVIAPDGAAVSVDGVERGVAPLARELLVAAAVSHVVRATLTDGMTAEKSIQISGGRTVTVELVIATTEPPAESDQSDVVNDPDMSAPLKTWGWVTLGVGGALLVAGGVTGGVALSVGSEVEDTCPDGCYSDDYHLVNERDNLALATDVLLGVGAAAAVTGAIMLLVDAVGGEADGTKVSVAPGSGGLVVWGRF